MKSPSSNPFVDFQKFNSRIRNSFPSVLAVCGAMTLLPLASQAASVYWDSDATGTGNNVTSGAGLGSAGNWNTSTANWWPGTGTTDQSWVNANNDTAIFWGTTAGTVVLTDNITVGGLQFKTTAYTVDAATNSKTLTFGAANNTITLNNVAAATITGTVGGAGNVSLVRTSSSTGTFTAGTLTLNDASAGGWFGTTSVGHGTTLALSAINQGLLSTSGITLNGGNITLTNSSTQAALDRVSNTAAITSNGGTLTYANTATSATTYAETIGSVALTTGKLNLTLSTANASGETQTLTLSGLTHPGAISTVAFSGPNGLNATASMMKVTGAAQTTAGQIIGPWATVVTTTASQTDYAVYDGSTNIVGAAIAGTGESSWNTTTNTFTQSSSLETLGATRTITALRNTGATATTALNGNNLETFGLLNGANTLWTISGTGNVRQQGTAAANLYVNAGAGAITINSVIANNTGALTLVKTGASTLTLGAVNTYTGDTVIQEGGVTANIANAVSASNLVIGSSSGGSAASFTNSGTLVGFNRAKNLTIYSNGTANFGGGAQNLDGTVTILGGTVSNNASQLYLNSTATMTGGTWAASTFGNNNFTTLASADTAVISGYLSGFLRTLTVADGAAATDLLVSGQVTSSSGLTKAGAGLMILSGNNNYTGTTTV
ncbi:MAG: autotransporter-associated beta strand repeat-containing protein, partial [Luteolibacter sp.]